MFIYDKIVVNNYLLYLRNRIKICIRIYLSSIFMFDCTHTRYLHMHSCANKPSRGLACTSLARLEIVEPELESSRTTSVWELDLILSTIQAFIYMSSPFVRAEHIQKLSYDSLELGFFSISPNEPKILFKFGSFTTWIGPSQALSC